MPWLVQSVIVLSQPGRGFSRVSKIVILAGAEETIGRSGFFGSTAGTRQLQRYRHSSRGSEGVSVGTKIESVIFRGIYLYPLMIVRPPCAESRHLGFSSPS